MELRKRLKESMHGSKKGILLTLLTIVLFILMLGELLTYVVININYSNIASQTASVFSSGSVAANLKLSTYNFLHQSLENSLSSLIAFESTPSLRRDNFTSNAASAMYGLVTNGSIYGHKLIQSNLSAFSKALIAQADYSGVALALVNQSLSIYQSSPFTISAEYTALALVNSTSGSFIYPLNVSASVSLLGKESLLGAEAGVPYTLFKGSQYPHATILGPQATAGSRSPYMSVYGKIKYFSGTGAASCTGSIASNASISSILAVSNAIGINQNACGYGGLITNVPNSSTPLEPYLVYSGSSIPSQIQSANNQYELLDGSALSMINIQELNNSLSQGYTYESPYAKSYLQQASNASFSSSPYGTTSFGPLGRQVASFSGTGNNYIATNGINVFENRSFTVSLWVELNVQNAGHYQDFITSGTATSSDTAFEIGTNINTATSNYYMAFLGDDIAVQGNIFMPHHWYYLTATWSNKTKLQQLYLNGVLVATRTSTGYLNTGMTNVCLGGGNTTCWSTGVTMNGSLANVQIYNQVLPGYKISQLYLQGIDGYPATNSGLVAWYPLDGNANDYSGNNYNGTLTSGVSYTGLYNYYGSNILSLGSSYNASPIYGFGCNNINACNQSALNLNNLPVTSGDVAVFNGQNSNITVPKAIIPSGASEFTAVLWLRPTGPISAYPTPLSETNGGFTIQACSTGEANGTSVTFWIDGQGNGNTCIAASKIYYNNWYLFALTYDGSTATEYLNGNSVYTQSFTTTLSPADITGIGTYPGYRNAWNGSIADVQIYNTALSSNNINLLYQEGINGAPLEAQGLQAWYPLDGNAQDYGPNNNDGVINDVAFANSSLIQSGLSSALNVSKAMLPGAASFNGENGYINASLATNAVDNTSISLWFDASNFTDPASGGEATLLLLGNNGGTNGYGLFVSTTGNLSILESSVRWISTPIKVSANKWYNVILNASPSGSDVVYNIYLDGTKVFNTSAESLPIAPAGSTSIGYYGSGSLSNFFFGKMADVQIYNTPLSKSQAIQLYDNNSVSGIAPIAYWPLSGGLNGSYNITPDISGNGHTGRLYSNLTTTSQECSSKDVVNGLCGVEYAN